MKNKKAIAPPRWAERFLGWYCRPELLEDLQGDLNEYFERNLHSRGAFVARVIYIIDTFKFFRRYTTRKPTISSSPFQNIMLGSYIKTSGRSIMRNKLFSGINIAGLAISMSVGLLVIAFVTDLLSYDNFQKKKDHIFRVVTSDQRTGEPVMKLATTSLKAETLIRQKIPGIEALVLMNRNFGGDARTTDKTIPLTGLYASESFFDVFSFQLIKGNPATALKEPYSLVLTEKAAAKLFGNAEPIGKLVKIDTISYLVTGLVKDPPKLSHIQFETLASYASINQKVTSSDGDPMDWGNIYSNYIYLIPSKNTSPAAITASLNKICDQENRVFKSRKISLELQPMKKIVIGKQLANEIGVGINSVVIWVLCGLAFIVILSACFNYTNLSLARSLRRSREVGIRKVVGARSGHVLKQFIIESLIISLGALVFSFLIFLFLRTQFLSFHPFLQSLVALELSPQVILYFMGLAMTVGLIAGLLPALFYSRINALLVLKDAASMKVFRHLSLRKALIFIQYTFSLIFITATIIGYNQYRGFLSFDLGFSTENILNIKLQGAKEDWVVKELSQLPAVKEISKSLIVTSLGSMYGSTAKYNNPMDSAMVFTNNIDEHYLPLHNHQFLAGRNFTAKPKDAPETEVIVNEQLLQRFNISPKNPGKALGETVQVSGKKLVIIGVLKDFHYGTMENSIDPTMLRYSADPGGYINAKIRTNDLPGTMAAITSIWKKIDPVHPLDAKFYDEQIEEAYSQFSVMARVIGFFSFLAICIASLGLLGMVIYTTEKRLKEISIRKVLGASEGMLVYLLSKGFLVLLIVAALIAIPATWLFFDKVVLVNFAYHQPISLGDILIGLVVVAAVACLMIGSHIMKIVRSNPAKVLKRE